MVYSNGEISVVWKPERCIHSAVCVKNSPAVFKPKERPWVKIEAEATSKIADTVKKCPSGALTYFMNAEGEKTKSMENEEIKTEIKLIPNGPLEVSGALHIHMQDGQAEEKTGKVYFCRCGASARKPFCDGSHKSAEFKG